MVQPEDFGLSQRLFLLLHLLQLSHFEVAIKPFDLYGLVQVSWLLLVDLWCERAVLEVLELFSPPCLRDLGLFILQSLLEVF